jgi:hypothetical protein
MKGGWGVTSNDFGGLQWTLRHAKLWRWYRILGRLQSWRIATQLWGKGRGLLLGAPPWVSSTTVFDAAWVPGAVADLRERGFYAGLQLPARLVEQLTRHAEQSHCFRLPRDTERFLIGEVKNGRSPRDRVVAVADVEAPSCPAAWQIAGDATLVEVVRTYLGYPPSRVAIRLYWSPMAGLSDKERRWNGQTIDYHYDIERRPTLYVYFYLSDVDDLCGAHVVVAGSHGNKPPRLKWASTRQREAVVLRRYGADKVVTLEGKAGFGFLEDPACFHKVLPPTVSDRLMLQLRYS